MIGKSIGPYTILRELGTGGMGTVYLATAPEGGQRAIKAVHPHLIATPGFFKRFLREAELGRQVKHDSVVRTLDVDATMVDGQQHSRAHHDDERSRAARGSEQALQNFIPCMQIVIY